MNILILTGRFGMGHYSVSEAIKQEVNNNYKDSNVKVVDIIEYLMPVASKTIYSTFNVLVTKWSNLYNFINGSNEEHIIKSFNYLFIKKIDKLLVDYKPDIIISTLPMSSQYISKYKSIKKSNIPLVTFITDISSHSEWLYKNTNFYCVGHEVIKESLIKKGISEDKIIITGIPVKEQFKDNTIIDKDNNIKEILIMGGGLGLIDLKKELFQALNDNNKIKVTVITGNNKRIYENIKSNYKNINVVGYTNKINEYMKNAHLIISKAGGITLFEAIYTEVPLYIVNPFLAQEIKNAHFIEEEKIGKVIWEKDFDIAKDIVELINDENKMLQMKSNMKKIKENINQHEIIDIIDKCNKGA